ncbi:MAG TPA: hypothetical protein VFJ82_06545 [Longimicrobium sp.]|nr:hypothetical protein [Longimicrobium sp.]
MTWRTRAALAALAGVMTAGCNLAEVATEPGEDVVVVEAVLRTDEPLQQVLLHHALQGRFSGGEAGAHVSVTGDDGRVHVLQQSTGCYRIDKKYQASDSLQFQGTCYVSPSTDAGWVLPGSTYDLLVETVDGRTIRGRTQVPGALAVPSINGNLGNGLRGCSLAPGTGFTLLWRQADGAASYVADLNINGLPHALGVPAPDPFELRGLAVSETDTTILFPKEFGVFERFNYDVDLLKAIENGFPEGVDMLLVLAAADRNWVNSVRGGNFNPSGLIRISTVVGDGVGVFGSLVVRRFTINVNAKTTIRRCGT